MKKSIENRGKTATGALKNEVAGKTKPFRYKTQPFVMQGGMIR
jgi:hypothetical protein